MHGMGERGGVLLDLVLATAVVLIGAFFLASMGFTFHGILHGAEHFFGI
jgi:hypothetical protein